MRFCVIFCAIIFILSACSFFEGGDIDLTTAKIVTGVDDKLMPVQAINIFPKGSSKVVCWFEWRDAKVNTQIMAKWHYVTDDIHILDYPFTVPNKQGSGSVALTSPEGKSLPMGQYKVDLLAGNRILKSLTFKIE